MRVSLLLILFLYAVFPVWGMGGELSQSFEGLSFQEKDAEIGDTKAKEAFLGEIALLETIIKNGEGARYPSGEEISSKAWKALGAMHAALGEHTSQTLRNVKSETFDTIWGQYLDAKEMFDSKTEDEQSFNAAVQVESERKLRKRSAPGPDFGSGSTLPSKTPSLLDLREGGGDDLRKTVLLKNSRSGSRGQFLDDLRG